MLPMGVCAFLTPLLPITAYALWLWASSSWTWRDRWASIWALAWRGGAFVALVFLVSLLSSTQAWVFPQLTATLQNAWSAHMPGELSLSPFDGRYSLVARTLLLLPLAPALALYFEKVDSRTQVQQQRILTAHDMAPKQPKAKQDAASTMQGTPRQEPTARVKLDSKPAVETTRREPGKQHSEGEPSLVEQITIESYLASNKDQTRAKPVPPRQRTTKKQKAETPAPAPSNPIDWNDVAE